MERTLASMVALALAAAMLAGCTAREMSGSRYPRIGEQAYTLVNLHPDEARGKLTSVNYQQDGFIPLCTPVTFTDGTRKSVSFQLDENGREYIYFRHRALRDSFWTHLDQYFGDRCTRDDVAGLGEVDREGIRRGTATVGMTKQGVIYAIGYPPEHATASLDFDRWQYWRDRFRTMVVHFEDGVVTRIE